MELIIEEIEDTTRHMEGMEVTYKDGLIVITSGKYTDETANRTISLDTVGISLVPDTNSIVQYDVFIDEMNGKYDYHVTRTARDSSFPEYNGGGFIVYTFMLVELHPDGTGTINVYRRKQIEPKTTDAPLESEIEGVGN